MKLFTALVAFLTLTAPIPPRADKAGNLVETYASAIEKINAAHARKPGDEAETELASLLHKNARRALSSLLGLESAEALQRAGEVAIDLALLEDFDKFCDRLLVLDPDRATGLGTAFVKERFLLRGMNGLDAVYLEHFAQVFQIVLKGYDELFGFKKFSKVLGKKLRVRVHLEEKITAPPHFDPQFPYHSEIDFPVVDPTLFKSPAFDGKFMFYGLCREFC